MLMNRPTDSHDDPRVHIDLKLNLDQAIRGSVQRIVEGRDLFDGIIRLDSIHEYGIEWCVFVWALAAIDAKVSTTSKAEYDLLVEEWNFVLLAQLQPINERRRPATKPVEERVSLLPFPFEINLDGVLEVQEMAFG
ncbi:hypothetical protein CTheo_8300 [Ceratobasidium theobromae]|uniref:Uncharacterized protein n=1 Tax=Ceratobasidium theobromae TaxID=1582974 RepID=A0A5N5Q9G5_9AGAM|nr:hypothetical protein CTheo_8300 [Ceratobasidium theobromae]